MPYGPGKFEGEPASTFLIHHTLMDGADDDAGNHALFKGALYPGSDSLNAASEAGYTEQEIGQSCQELAHMVGAIAYEDEQGFAYASIYTDVDDLENQWARIQNSYAEEAVE